MKPTALFLALLASTGLQAQTPADSTLPLARKTSATFRPLYTINGKELARYPATSFMELVNGAFPFATHEVIRAQDYSFLVDGHVLPDPQGINLSQIESIAYYPQGTYLLTGAPAGRGTFVIRTRTADTGLRLQASAGVLFPSHSAANDYFGQAPEVDEHSSVYTHLEATTGARIGAGRWSGALGYTRFGEPTYHNRGFSAYSDIGYSDADRYRLRLSQFLQLPLGHNFRLGAALMGTYQSADMRFTKPNFNIGYHQARTHRSLALGAAASLAYDTEPLHNTLRISFSPESRRLDENYTGGSGFQQPLTDVYQRSNGGALTIANDFSYTIVQSGGFRLEGTAQLQYQRDNRSDSLFRHFYSGPFGGGGELWSNEKVVVKTLQATPGLLFDWRGIIQGEAQLVWERLETSLFPKGLNRFDSLYPHGALRFDAAPLLGKGALSRFEIGTDYRKRRIRETTEHALDNDPQYPVDFVQGNPYQTIAETWTQHVQLGLAQDRVGISVQWIHSDEDRASIDYNPNVGYTERFVPVRRRSLGFALRGEIIRGAKLSWTLQASAYRDRYAIKGGLNNFGFSSPDPYVNNNLDGKAWRGGLQTAFQYGGFHLQSMLLGVFHRYEGAGMGTADPYTSKVSITNLLIGYTIRPKQGRLSSIELNLQGRNLPVLRTAEVYAYRFPYAGLGLIAGLR